MRDRARTEQAVYVLGRQDCTYGPRRPFGGLQRAGPCGAFCYSCALALVKPIEPISNSCALDAFRLAAARLLLAAVVRWRAGSPIGDAGM